MPAFEKPEPVAAPESFEAIFENYLDRYVKRQGLRSAGEIERSFRKYILPKWKNRPFEEIRRSDVTRLLDDIEDENGPVMADRCLAYLSKLFNWHVSRTDDYVSPVVRGMARTKPRERARERTLSDEEIRVLWPVWAQGGTFGAMLQIALLTGQRRAKVAGMRWGDIDLESGIWTIPTEASEKSNAGSLSLPVLALEIIKEQPLVGDNPQVFAGRGKVAIGGFSALKRSLDEKVKVDHWTIHDLRRTAKSLMARAGVRPDISERVLGHVIAGVEGTYDRHGYDKEKAEALAKMSALVERILNPTSENVVQMRELAQ